jgi:hypothetical protein
MPQNETMTRPQFTRKTVLVACDFIANHPAMFTHAKFDSFILELGAETDVPICKGQGTIAEKALRLKKYLVTHPTARMPDGEFMVDAVVRKAASLPNSYGDEEFVRALSRDGFSVTEHGLIRRMLPILADVTGADDDVHALLDELGLSVAKGHLDHAVDLHGQGKWAPANSELRKVLESIFDDAAEKLEPTRAGTTNRGHDRRRLLAALNPPFLIEALGEWDDSGKNFVNGVFKRLHPGAHPGMSEDEDCTFRLHLVLIVARVFLRRLQARLGSRD